MKHPLRCDENLGRKTYEALCNKIQKFYGVTDAEIFFTAKRKAILAKCDPDEFGFANFSNLKDWHNAKILEYRMGLF